MAPDVATSMRKKLGDFGRRACAGLLACLMAYGPAATMPAHAAMSNSARASGNLPDGSPVSSDVSTVDVTITGARPGLTLQKTATLDDGGDGRADAGDTVTYSFVLRNTGNITLVDIALSDPLAGIEVSGSPVGSLAPGGEDATVTARYVLTQDDLDRGVVTNQAKAVAYLPDRSDSVTTASDDDNGATDGNGDGDPFNDPTALELTGVPTLNVQKTGKTAGYEAVGDTVEFEIALANTGNVTLRSVTPEDDAADSLDCPSGLPIPVMAPGATETCVATHLVTDAHMKTGVVPDTVDVSAILPGGGGFGPVSDSAEIGVSRATVTGYVYRDVDGDGRFDPQKDNALSGYTVDLLDASGKVIMSVKTAQDGSYRMTDVLPADGYSLVFRDPGGNTVGGMDELNVAPGGNIVDQNMPIDPSGVVYDAVTGSPVAGALVSMTNAAGTPLPTVCFVDPAQQNTTTAADGAYRFDIFPGKDPLCPDTEAEYRITVRAPAGYASAPSSAHPPLQGPLDVTACVFDATPGGTCEPAAAAVPPAGPATLPYILAFLLQPGDRNVIHNHIPLDPFATTGNVTITKAAGQPTLRRGERVTYTIRVANNSTDDAGQVRIVDRTPPGFAYVPNSATVNGTAVSPVVTAARIDFGLMPLGPDARIEVVLTLQSLASAGPGDYVNRADVSDSAGTALAPTATATVELVAEPVFDCSDVIGKVFSDVNGNGYQDAGEKGLAGVRLATVRGGLITTDSHGRFHVPCADMPERDIGSNFILKLDERTLPAGYRLTTENPRVVRLTPGKMVEMNFGAAAGREIRLDLKDEAFEAGSERLAPRWQAGVERLVAILKGEYSYLTVVYRTSQDKALASARMRELRSDVEKQWKKAGAPYDLVIDIRQERE